MLEYDGELADGGGIPAPLEVVVFVVVDVVVFVCPSLLFVVVLSYPPVIFVFEPDVLVCVFVSSAITGLVHIDTKINVTNIVIICSQNFIFPPEKVLYFK
jgi:Ca2+/H+ antiporter